MGFRVCLCAQLIVAWQLGPQLPNLIGGTFVLVLYILWEKVRACVRRATSPDARC